MTPHRSLRRAAAALTVAAALVAVACGPTDTPKARVAAQRVPCTVDLVGDSLGVGAHRHGNLAGQLRAAGCELRNVDTVGGRFPEQGAAVVEAWAANRALSNIVVVVLGTNDCRNEAAMVRAVHRIGRAAGPHRPIVWVNVWRAGCDHIPNRVLDNTIIEAHHARPDHGRMWLVDHRAWIAAQPARAVDGIHLGPAGYTEYSRRIVNTITTGTR